MGEQIGRLVQERRRLIIEASVEEGIEESSLVSSISNFSVIS